MHSNFKIRPLAFALAIAAVPTFASAAFVNFGDIYDPAGDVVFEDVTEDNSLPTTVFAPEAVGPTAFGNSLVLDPTNFRVEAMGGEVDFLDSELSTTIVAKEGFVIESIVLDEFGSYSLGGLTGGEAEAMVNAAVFIKRVVVDGETIVLPGLNVPFTATGGGDYSRPADDGIAQPWNGSASVDLDVALGQLDISGDVTSVTLVFDNALFAAADDVSLAFIDKKGISITVDTDGDPVIPEPASLALAVLGIVGVARRRR